MKKKTLCLCLIGLLAAAGLLTGCTRTSEELILSKENSATEEEIKTSLPENKDLDEVPLDEEETEREAAPVPEDGKAVSRSAYSVTLTDTVKYVESSRKEITSPFIKSFLYYVPYACLAAMTFPAILSATDSVISAAVGFVVALIAAYKEKSLLTVALFACAAVFIVERILQLAM